MAKATKSAALSSDEHLQQALVPKEEQPYRIPKNWVWTRLRRMVATSKERTIDFSIGNHRFVGLEHLEGNIGISGFSSTGNIKSPKNVFHSGEILYGKLRPYLNKHGLAEWDGVCSTDILVFRVMPAAIPEYVNYFLDTDALIKFAVENSKGINLPRVSEKTLVTIPCPLPPLPEQQRIVDCIESLFSKLDNAKEIVQNALDSFETRKAAILHKAFTGELTAKWREEHNVGFGSWHQKRFDQVADIKSNLVKPEEYQNFPHIAPDNIEKKTGILLNYHTISEDKVISSNHRFYPGQILYSKIRPYLSKVVMIDFDGLCSADMYPIEAKESTRYLWYFMLSDGFLEQASSAGTRSVLPKINQKELSALSVTIPTFDEQAEIVRILDDVFPKEQQAKKVAEAVLGQIDLMKKAILARAFRGELGTNDPKEESAIELLKQCINNE